MKHAIISEFTYIFHSLITIWCFHVRHRLLRCKPPQIGQPPFPWLTSSFYIFIISSSVLSPPGQSFSFFAVSPTLSSAFSVRTRGLPTFSEREARTNAKWSPKRGDGHCVTVHIALVCGGQNVRMLGCVCLCVVCEPWFVRCGVGGFLRKGYDISKRKRPQLFAQEWRWTVKQQTPSNYSRNSKPKRETRELDKA